MPLPIQRVPIGLLEFLGLKGSGGNPSQMSEVLVGQLDLSQFYLAPNLKAGAFNTVTANATGTWVATGSTVPPGELWLVRGISVSAAMGAGEACTIAFMALQGGVYHTLNEPRTFVAGDSIFHGITFDTPRLYTSGCNFGIQVIAHTALSEVFTVRLDYYALTF